jgi:Asp/Glu/Hydantoin racemase
MPTIGFLHTAEVHVATFRGLVREAALDARDVHVVDPGLLAEARELGIGDGLRERIAEHLRVLAREADAIVCTCSTIGGHAEALADGLPVPVMRVDRPMAEQAVSAGGRVTVVAAVESTLEPTRVLLEECANGPGTNILVSPCVEAWPLFEAGDLEGYGEVLAEHVRQIAGQTDVIVLAQASMALVEPLVADLDVPVLCSPRLGVQAAARLAGA